MLDRVEALVQRGDATVAYLNVHVANQASRHSDLKEFLQSVDLCYADGAGVVLGARLLGHELPERMTGADWVWDLAARCEGRYRLAWIGGAEGVARRAADALVARHPGLEVWTAHGFHADHAVPAMLAECAAFEPHIVLVGMGTPAQERWVARWRSSISAPVVWCTGATADFVSGQTERGPEWLHQRQEWLARLVVDPRRLWRRYLVGNPLFLARVVRERVGRG
jgi:N-acetylglucosaminyldiphosphoundecaprenol N-acetyl-beta-D-mannosaminyltransferase